MTVLVYYINTTSRYNVFRTICFRVTVKIASREMCTFNICVIRPSDNRILPEIGAYKMVDCRRSRRGSGGRQTPSSLVNQFGLLGHTPLTVSLFLIWENTKNDRHLKMRSLTIPDHFFRKFCLLVQGVGKHFFLFIFFTPPSNFDHYAG